MSILTRRQMLMASAASVSLAATPRVRAAALADRLPETLVRRARGALERHRGVITATDRIAIADFSRPSNTARFFLVDVESGRTTAHLVAHGRGSDPAHTGWVERFSNAPGSNASSSGAYITGEIYTGKHGPSRRLIGLDPMNSNAESRAIVIHAAPYVSERLAQETGKIGRSEGCFAVATESIDEVLAQLGPGRLLYADKL
jgi:L,D-transpeptidase catalytic domain